jgi:hypothetical protein
MGPAGNGRGEGARASKRDGGGVMAPRPSKAVYGLPIGFRLFTSGKGFTPNLT